MNGEVRCLGGERSCTIIHQRTSSVLQRFERRGEFGVLGELCKYQKQELLVVLVLPRGRTVDFHFSVEFELKLVSQAHSKGICVSACRMMVTLCVYVR